MTKARPILFSAPMVQALLAGRKTETRRVIKPQPDSFMSGFPMKKPYWKGKTEITERIFCPYGKVGDLLWVRETWQTGMTENGPRIAYKASETEFEIDAWDDEDFGAGPSFNYKKCPKADWNTWLPDLLIGAEGNWRPSIFMPRWASRITLEIVSIRGERLHDINEQGSVKEGIERRSGFGTGMKPTSKWECYTTKNSGFDNPIFSYKSLWELLNGKDSWWQNPWVWVVEFKVHECNVDTLLKGSVDAAA